VIAWQNAKFSFVLAVVSCEIDRLSLVKKPHINKCGPHTP